MKAFKIRLIPILLLSFLFSCITKDKAKDQDTPTLREAFSGEFLIGTALSVSQIKGENPETMNVVRKHFNAIVAENSMKSAYIQPEEDEFDFSISDKFVNFGEKNDMFITGHTLIWHSQAPEWFFQDQEGNDATREMLIQRMKDHIQTVVGRYKGKVNGWDVVNEAILDDGSYRKSKFYEIIGEEYIQLAFQFAREADPDAELYYNDYSMAVENKREGVVQMIKELQNEDVKIDGIGMQGHVGLEHPDINDFEKSIEAFSNLGVKVMITEMDISVLPMVDPAIGAEVSANHEYDKELNPYTEGLPDSVYIVFEKRYLDFFELFLKHQDVISRVTFWGVNDGDSWKNDWPVKGRRDYPLLFDRENNPKPLVNKIIKKAVNK